MTKTYDVYEKRDEEKTVTWAYALEADQVVTLKVDTRGGFQRAIAKPGDLGSLVQKHLRSGYRFKGRGLFFDEDMLCFLSVHPDFVRTTKTGRYVLFSQVPSIEASILRIDNNLDKAIANHILDPQVGREWIKAIEQGTDFLVASDAHPRWSLLIAEEAISIDAMVSSARSGRPTVRPSESPKEWEVWLSQFFDRRLINRSLIALAWGLHVSPSIPELTSPSAQSIPAFIL